MDRWLVIHVWLSCKRVDSYKYMQLLLVHVYYAHNESAYNMCGATCSHLRYSVYA